MIAAPGRGEITAMLVLARRLAARCARATAHGTRAAAILPAGH
jgi:hypothetical protein